MAICRQHLLFVAACLFACFVNGQTPSEGAKYLIEIPTKNGPPEGVSVGPGIVDAYLNWSQLGETVNANGAPAPAALKLRHELDGDKVVFHASLLYGDFDEMVRNHYKSAREEQLGTYSANLNDAVTLREMVRFGLQPITLRVVTGRSVDSTRPQVVTKAPSIQLLMVGEDRQRWFLSVKNNSSKGVIAYQIWAPVENGGRGMTTGGNGVAVLAPGAEKRLEMFKTASRRMVNGRWVDNPPPDQIFLQVAVFEDGTYEGDEVTAAEIVGQEAGATFQRTRINDIIERVIADTEMNDSAKVKRIRTEVASLSEKSSPEALAAVREQFRSIPVDVFNVNVSRAFGLGMNQEKQTATFRLDDFEQNRLARPQATLTQWWQWVKTTRR